jgi:TonB family protein
MPIIQIPLLEEMRKGPATPDGEPAPSAQATLFPPPPSLDTRLHKGAFTLLDDDLELQLERSKLREAFWISLIVHGILAILIIWLIPKIDAWRRATAPENRLALALQDHQLTFLTLPPSEIQKPLEPTNKISDQDRRAALRHPDLQTLRELEEARRAGAPEPMQAPAVRTPPPGQQAQQQQQAAGQQIPLEQQKNTTAKLEQPAMTRQGNPFAAALAPGSVIEQAERASADRRASGLTTGDYGIGPGAQPTKLRNDVDILSDTMGVDFGPYLSRVIETLRQNWYNLIPEEARAPLMKSGKVSIDFVILKDGSVAGMNIVTPSGDVALDRAAFGGIKASDPFQRLPQEFAGQYLKLRIHFFYNPQRSDLR